METMFIVGEPADSCSARWTDA